MRIVVTGRPSWKTRAGSWFGVWSSSERVSWSQSSRESHLRETATEASERTSLPRKQESEGSWPRTRLRNAIPATIWSAPFQWADRGGKAVAAGGAAPPAAQSLGSLSWPAPDEPSVWGQCRCVSPSPDIAKAGFPPQFFDVRALKLVSGLLGLASYGWRPPWIPQIGSPTTSPLGVLTHSRIPPLSPGLTFVVIQNISRSTDYGPHLVLALGMHLELPVPPTVLLLIGIYLVFTVYWVLGFVHELEQGWGVSARVNMMVSALIFTAL